MAHSVFPENFDPAEAMANIEALQKKAKEEQQAIILASQKQDQQKGHDCSSVHPYLTHAAWKTVTFQQHYSGTVHILPDSALAIKTAIYPEPGVSYSAMDASMTQQAYAHWKNLCDNATDPNGDNGTFTVWPCPEVDAYKIEWQPPTVTHLVSAQMLEGVPPEKEAQIMRMATMRMAGYLRDRLKVVSEEYFSQAMTASKQKQHTPSFVHGVHELYKKMWDGMSNKGKSYSHMVQSIWGNTIDAQMESMIVQGFHVHGSMEQPVSPPSNSIVDTLNELIPGFAKMKQPCPVKYDPTLAAHDGGDSDRFTKKHCGSKEWRSKKVLLNATVQHLNDQHHWTREEIADWLETLDHDLTLKKPEKPEGVKII